MEGENSQLKSKTNNSTAQLIGIKAFSRNGIATDRGDELVFFSLKPTNISVLSPVNISIKVKKLMELLSAQPDIEICCLDDQECFDGNKEYLAKRIERDPNPKLRELLEKDRRFLDDVQIQMSTARQFMFIVRIRNESVEQSFATLNRIHQAITSQGFDARRCTPDEIKRFLTLYFLRQMPAAEIPNTDGEDIVDEWIIPD